MGGSEIWKMQLKTRKCDAFETSGSEISSSKFPQTLISFLLRHFRDDDYGGDGDSDDGDCDGGARDVHDDACEKETDFF